MKLRRRIRFRTPPSRRVQSVVTVKLRAVSFRRPPRLQIVGSSSSAVPSFSPTIGEPNRGSIRSVEPRKDPFLNQVSYICTTDPLAFNCLQFGPTSCRFPRLLFNYGLHFKQCNITLTL
ncbi:hypothetical protein F2Q69_00044528 [Brassica cretica]|uniref:Uncharacterized protein n=2 Tax=Brassica TaxID=3705 RepID=A0A8S9NMV4_BRACR|nr:hypothetical protein F2Q69_00044528 [Brassica cretica]